MPLENETVDTAKRIYVNNSGDKSKQLPHTFRNWLQDFCNFAGVLGEKFLELDSSLFGYVDLIWGAYKIYGGQCWSFSRSISSVQARRLLDICWYTASTTSTSPLVSQLTMGLTRRSPWFNMPPFDAALSLLRSAGESALLAMTDIKLAFHPGTTSILYANLASFTSKDTKTSTILPQTALLF